jgi:hypothetical protein
MRHGVVIRCIAIAMVACEEETCVPNSFYDPKPLWIDNQCDATVRAAIVDAADTLNEFAEDNICQPLMEIRGDVDVDHSVLDPELDVDNVIICYDEEPIWYVDEYDGEDGNSSSDIVRLFVFLFQTDIYNEVRRLALHELTHWVAARPGVKGIGHIPEGEYGVMASGSSHGTDGYTDLDRELFCDSFDCV